MRADMKDRLAVSRRVAEFHATPEGRALYRQLNEGDGVRIIIALETDTLTYVHGSSITEKAGAFYWSPAQQTDRFGMRFWKERTCNSSWSVRAHFQLRAPRVGSLTVWPHRTSICAYRAWASNAHQMCDLRKRSLPPLRCRWQSKKMTGLTARFAVIST